ncbi:transmembrane protein 14A isoform X2 [Alligator mississippiensis]|uniref:transmembrane protein 14A isoform X2 n=1 Tax=Alligator mississippiensis TaxID=8496 RepID=UPI000907359D|nr:transmembrane protein 14A isoform X2 [Alligator mississippiensis]
MIPPHPDNLVPPQTREALVDHAGAVRRVVTMAVDWIGFGYAVLLAAGGAMGYVRKGSKISLVAGLIFGSVAGYGAYCVTHDPRDVKISLFSAFLLTIVMGVRFKRSKKLMPAGLIAGIRIAKYL